jgi:O-methyltransferase involved in polyketide biosynthesis
LYNLDLPESIEFRKKYFGQENWIKSIKKSVFDKSWFDDINYKEWDNIFFLALWLFDYFKADKVRNLLNDMAKKFPNWELFLNSSYEKSKIVTNNGYCPKNLRFNFENLYWFLKENENIGLKNRENFINIIIKFRKLFRERISDIIEKVNKSWNLDENMIIYELSNVLYNNPMELILLNFNKRISNIL